MGDDDKLDSFEHSVGESLFLTDTAAKLCLGCSFAALAFDTPGTPPNQVTDIVKQRVGHISMQSASTRATAENCVRQKLSFAIGSR